MMGYAIRKLKAVRVVRMLEYMDIISVKNVNRGIFNKLEFVIKIKLAVKAMCLIIITKLNARSAQLTTI